MTITNETELRQLFRSIPAGSLTTIAGGSGSGKTASCAVAIDEFKSQGLTVAYVETEEFDITRFLPEGVKPDLAYTAYNSLRGCADLFQRIFGQFDVVVVDDFSNLRVPAGCEGDDKDRMIDSAFKNFVSTCYALARKTGSRVIVTSHISLFSFRVNSDSSERFQVLSTPSPLYVREAWVAPFPKVTVAKGVTQVFLGTQPADQSLQG